MIRKIRRKGPGSKYNRGRDADGGIIPQPKHCKVVGPNMGCEWESRPDICYRVKCEHLAESRAKTPISCAPDAPESQSEGGKGSKAGVRNKYKEQLDMLLRAKFPDIATEYRFHKDRRWKFDYALQDFKFAFEYEGIFSDKSRHTGISGYIGDIDKYNEAAFMGWKVFRITAAHIQDGRAWELINRLTRMRQ